ncbi:MAG: transposase [Pirellulales bacterium]|nr:transposase [Pirellulales bacterium]
MSASEFPPAYLITFHTYGSWLHGEAKGSVDRQHNRPTTDFAPADERRVAAMQHRMTSETVILNEAQRKSVEQTIAEVCRHRNWELLAANVRTNHVHVVIAAPVEPEKVMNDLKA